MNENTPYGTLLFRPGWAEKDSFGTAFLKIFLQKCGFCGTGGSLSGRRFGTPSARFSFTGKERDSESGFYYFGARYHDPDLLTSFLSVDPLSDKYPSISPYAYCAWNPMKLVDPDGMDFDPTMEKYVSQAERYCDIQIKNLSGKVSPTEEQIDQLSDFQSTKEEIKKMRDDKSTYYCARSGSFGEKEKRTKGITQCSGDITHNGKKQHKIMVSLNTDCGLFSEKGGLNRKGLQTLAHELKHCYQFYNKETLYVQPAEGDGFKVYNTQALEETAFKRGTTFGSFDRFDPSYYPDLFIGTMDDFVKYNPGCKVIKHK